MPKANWGATTALDIERINQRAEDDAWLRRMNAQAEMQRNLAITSRKPVSGPRDNTAYEADAPAGQFYSKWSFHCPDCGERVGKGELAGYNESDEVVGDCCFVSRYNY